MYIGEVSKITGASVKAIRLYHEMGLLPNLKRAGKYRVFSEDEVRLIKVIKQAQAAGFTLSEIKAIIRNRGGSSTISFSLVQEMINKKEKDINEEINKLRRKQERLNDYKYIWL